MPYRKAVFSFFALLVTQGLAQEFRASLNGAVTDAQGGAVPQAKISLVQDDTKATFTAVSGAAGQYTVPLVPPGVYTLTVEAPGLQRYVRNGLALTANQRATVDITLQVAGVTESVTVTAGAPILNTASAAVGQSVSGSLASELPLNGRAALALARLAFGVVGGSYTLARPFDSGSSTGYTMGGAGGPELLMDGGPDMASNANGSGRRANYQPPVDSVLEVKVETFQSDAAYGNTNSGMVNVITKGGSNQLHGSVSWYNQISKLTATPFFVNRAGSTKNTTLYNQWALTAGGPLLLPKIFNGKNRVFWYFAYEGVKHTLPQPTTLTLPTAAEKGGDFSALLKVGNNFQLYDPATAVAVGSRRQRLPFAGNIIPANRLNPIALKYLDFYPVANQPGLADGENNYFTPMKRHDDYYSLLNRFDFNISDRNKLTWKMYNNYRTEYIRKRFDNIATGEIRPRNGIGVNIDDVYTVNSTMVLDVRLNWTRMWDAEFRQSDGYDFSQLGFPSSLVKASQHLVVPVISFTDPTFGVGGTGQNVGAGFVVPYDGYQLFSTLNKFVGSHVLKFGLDLRLAKQSSLNYLYSSGLYTFGTNWVNGPLDNAAGAPMGQSFASFLIGLPTAGEFDVNGARSNQAYYYSGFVQDDWRVSKTLSLNLGLRYEKETPTVERYDRTLAGFDFSLPNAITTAAKAAYAASPIPELPAASFNPGGGPIFASPQKREVYETGSKNFSPRFGFAWSPTLLGGKTVVRGGFGIFFATIGTDGVQQPGFSQATPLVATLDGYLTSNVTLSNPFPGGLFQPNGAASGINTYLGQSITFTSPKIRSPYTERWTLTVQHQLRGNLVLELGYMGSRSIHLMRNETLNYTPAQFLSTSPARDNTVINRLSANVANPFQGLLPGTTLNGSTISVAQLLTAKPQLTGLTQYQVNNGYSDFHMLQARVEKRFSAGLQFLTNFQLMRQMDSTSRLNLTDPFLTRQVAGSDRPFKLVFTGSYELPFGKGKLLLGNANAVANQLVSGWKIAGTMTIEGQGPLSWGNVIYFGGDLNYDPRNIDRTFDTTKFNTVSSQQLANNIRTFPATFSNLRPDALKNLDAAVSRDIKVRELLTVQFRFEAFNALNRPQFSGASLTPTAATFGKITAQANDPRTIQTGLRIVW